jgi:hypothetical protein
MMRPGHAGAAAAQEHRRRYRDRFEHRDGQWRFAERRVRVDLVGDVSHLLRQPK